MTTRIEISDGVLFRELQGEAVLLDLGSQRYFGLNEVGTRAWQLLQEHGEVEAVAATLLAEFEVEPTQLRQDLDELLGNLEQAGLIRRPAAIAGGAG